MSHFSSVMRNVILRTVYIWWGLSNLLVAVNNFDFIKKKIISVISQIMRKLTRCQKKKNHNNNNSSNSQVFGTDNKLNATRSRETRGEKHYTAD